ncbi:MAG: glycosyltransferase family 39 protein [Candidatus Andersenbacteria bacterium]|nr:glycosyltransferase family 39 protein [Candidatus Andersenbacteria bacterium]
MDFKSNYRKLEEFVSVMMIIFSGFVMVAIFKINNFWTFASLDEMFWHYRSSVFWDKMLSFDFTGLVQSAQPGITVYWFTGFMMKFIDFDFNDINRRIAEKEAQGLDFNSVMNVNDMTIYKAYETISFAFNVPLFLLMVAFFISFYYLLKKLEFNRTISSFSLLFLVTSIYLHYWVTPSDKMLNIFITLSFLTILIHLTKKADKKYLILSAIFGAWAVLSKLSALFILPFYFFIFIYYKWPLNKEKIKLILKNYFFWITIFVFTSIIFLPSIITNPEEVYNLFFKSKYIFEESYSAGNYVSRVVFDYAKLFSFAVIGYMTQISVLSLMAYPFLRCSKKYRNVFNSLPQKHIKAIIAYIILFIIMVTLMSKNHDIRFMSPAFVMLNVISAIGLYGAVEILAKKNEINEKFKNFFYAAIFFVAIMFQALFIISSGLLVKKITEGDFIKFF